MANDRCKNVVKRRKSTLPPLCQHIKPPAFSCPKNGCPPCETCPRIPRCPSPCLPLIWRTPPEPPKSKPTICIARPCQQRTGSVPFQSHSRPKIEPPPSTVTFAIRFTCEGPTYCPCYSPGISK